MTATCVSECTHYILYNTQQRMWSQLKIVTMTSCYFFPFSVWKDRNITIVGFGTRFESENWNSIRNSLQSESIVESTLCIYHKSNSHSISRKVLPGQTETFHNDYYYLFFNMWYSIYLIHTFDLFIVQCQQKKLENIILVGPANRWSTRLPSDDVCHGRNYLATASKFAE